MAVQDDQSTTKKCTHLLIRCPTIYFIILPLVLSNCPTYFSILPLVFSRCSTFFNIMCFQCFSSLFPIYFIIFSIGFRRFFLPVFFGKFQKAFSIQKCTSGAGFDRLPFFGRICYTYCTVLVFSIINYLFPEMVVQGDQFTRKSTHICRSGGPPKETLFCIHMQDVASTKASSLVDP